MGRKKEAFGLSLLDVLSNALVGAIVLMLIASVLMNIVDKTDAVDDAGDSRIRTTRLLKPVDKRESDHILNISMTMKGADAEGCMIRVSPGYGIDQAALDTCVHVLQGTYDRSIWLVTRSCSWREGEWVVEVLARNSKVQLPDTVLLHIQLGVHPLDHTRPLLLADHPSPYPLLQITEQGDSISQILELP